MFLFLHFFLQRYTESLSRENQHNKLITQTSHTHSEAQQTRKTHQSIKLSIMKSFLELTPFADFHRGGDAKFNLSNEVYLTGMEELNAKPAVTFKRPKDAQDFDEERGSSSEGEEGGSADSQDNEDSSEDDFEIVGAEAGAFLGANLTEEEQLALEDGLDRKRRRRSVKELLALPRSSEAGWAARYGSQCCEEGCDNILEGDMAVEHSNLKRGWDLQPRCYVCHHKKVCVTKFS